MRKNKKVNDPNILVEKQKFYISEFEQEAAWLSFMHREGWKFVSTDGFHYQFEKTEKEDMVYEMDYLESGVAGDDYLQMYRDYGWEFVCQCDHWCYFRKQRTEGDEADTVLFRDRESKLELCKRVVHGQFLRMLPFILLMPSMLNLFRLSKPTEHFGPVFGTALTVISILSLGIFIVPLIIYFNQINRLNKLIKELEGTK
jgi:hypothetical protein